jgi:hypothetical protein
MAANSQGVPAVSDARDTPPRMRNLLIALALAACVPPTVTPAHRAPPPPIGGLEALRVSDPVIDVGERFGAGSPLVFEFHVPDGVVIPGRGLPPDVAANTPLQVAYPDADDRSVVQLEIPTSRQGLTDEEDPLASINHFDPPRLCRVGRACLWGDDDDGRWRAWRVREGSLGEVVTELQLAFTWTDPMDVGIVPSWRVVALWMSETDTPLDAHDRIRFEYVGDAPRKATEWTADGEASPLRARLRYRPASPDPMLECPAFENACWTLLDASDVQPIDVVAGPPRWVKVHAPFDIVRGAQTVVRVVVLDQQMNPTRATGTVQLRTMVSPIGAPITLNGAWTASTTITPLAAGLFSLHGTTDLANVNVGPQPIKVWEPNQRPFVRLAGDVHIHSGGDGDLAFSRSALHGDHRGNFVRNTDALRYLREVAGLDFGAISEHAIHYEGWTPPAGFTTFGPGGPCEVDAAVEPGAGDWWTPSQAASLGFQNANPGFITFPAYEWHGKMDVPGVDASLHKIVLFRDHDELTPFGHPMLPGNVRDRPPQCLFRWLDDHGLDNDRVLVMPHMMFARPGNRDWELTYAPLPAWAAVAAAERANHYQSVGEIYSSRNAAGGVAAFTALTRFEGPQVQVATAPYTWRTGWRDTEAVIGVIGASDNHVGMPGSDEIDPTHPHGAVAEPGGYAFVLADSPDRDGIYDALQQRHTYATSGIRALLDWNVSDGLTTWRMGDEIVAGSACRLRSNVEIAAPKNLRTVAIWANEVGSARAWTPALFRQPYNREAGQIISYIPNPVPAGGERQTWLYYIRAFAGPTLSARANTAEVAAGHQDAIWSSPVWITWDAPVCP